MNVSEVKSLDLGEKIAIVALYIVRLASKTEKYKEAYPEFLTILAVVYKQKYNSLKNYKDTFDHFFDNGRKGWECESIEKINPNLYKIYKKYIDYSVKELEIITKIIIEEAESYITYPKTDL